LAICCALRESSISDPFFLFKNFVNRGAFAAAAFFGFVCALLYGVEALFRLIRIVKARK